MQNDLLYDYIAPDSQVESNYTDVMFINEMHKDLIPHKKFTKFNDVQ